MILFSPFFYICCGCLLHIDFDTLDNHIIGMVFIDTITMYIVCIM